MAIDINKYLPKDEEDKGIDSDKYVSPPFSEAQLGLIDEFEQSAGIDVDKYMPNSSGDTSGQEISAKSSVDIDKYLSPAEDVTEPSMATPSAADNLPELPGWLSAIEQYHPMYTEKEIAAQFVGFGHGIQEVYRAGKQLIAEYAPALADSLGIDAKHMADNEEVMNDLYDDPEVGSHAFAGQITGMLAEPVSLLIPGAKANTAGKMIAKSTALGSAFGFMTYVDESKGESRLQNTVIGAGGGAVFGTVLASPQISRAVSTKLGSTQKKAVRDFKRSLLSLVLI